MHLQFQEIIWRQLSDLIGGAAYQQKGSRGQHREKALQFGGTRAPTDRQREDIKFVCRPHSPTKASGDNTGRVSSLPSSATAVTVKGQASGLTADTTQLQANGGPILVPE